MALRWTRRTDFGRHGFIARGRSLPTTVLDVGARASLYYVVGMVLSFSTAWPDHAPMVRKCVARINHRSGRLWLVGP
jgi:hypothetical protein